MWSVFNWYADYLDALDKIKDYQSYVRSHSHAAATTLREAVMPTLDSAKRRAGHALVAADVLLSRQPLALSSRFTHKHQEVW